MTFGTEWLSMWYKWQEREDLLAKKGLMYEPEEYVYQEEKERDAGIFYDSNVTGRERL
jgi:hypothetical protein